MNLILQKIFLNCFTFIKVSCYVEKFYYLCIIASSTGYFYIARHHYPLSPNIGRGFFLLRVSASLRLIYESNKIPFLAVDQNKKSILENFSKCGQCPKSDNPRPYKDLLRSTEESLVRKAVHWVCLRVNALYVNALNHPLLGFIGIKGLCKIEK